MPRIHPNITICGRANNGCVEKLRHEIHVGTNDSFKCDCPYGCHDIKFEMELSSTPIVDKVLPVVGKVGHSASNTSILQVYYKRGYYRSQDKEELIGFTEFLCKNKLNRDENSNYLTKKKLLLSANIGGLLGLFMGFSIFSIIEIFYFILIRPYCNCMRDAARRRQTIQRGFSRFNNIKLRRFNSNVVSARRMNNIIFPH